MFDLLNQRSSIVFPFQNDGMKNNAC